MGRLDPAAVPALHLKPADGVGQQHGECVGVATGMDPHLPCAVVGGLGGRGILGRIVEQADVGERPVEGAEDSRLVQPGRQGEGPQKPIGDPAQRRPIGLHRSAKARRLRRPDVGAVERHPAAHQGIVGRQVEMELVALVEVRRAAAVVGAEGRHGDVAPVALPGHRER